MPQEAPETNSKCLRPHEANRALFRATEARVVHFIKYHLHLSPNSIELWWVSLDTFSRGPLGVKLKEMKLFSLILICGAFSISGNAYAQTGAEYGASLGLGAGLANHLGKKLNANLDSAVSTISFSGDTPTTQPPQGAAQAPAVRNPSSNSGTQP
jgi:hypothetical protein